MSKKCRRCGVEKELSDFWKNVSAPDGHRATCIMCEAHPTMVDGGEMAAYKYAVLSSERPPDTPLAEHNPHQGGNMVEMVELKIEHGNYAIQDFDKCWVCGDHDVLFKVRLINSKTVIVTTICNDCILSSHQEDTLYAMIDGEIATVKYMNR